MRVIRACVRACTISAQPQKALIDRNTFWVDLTCSFGRFRRGTGRPHAQAPAPTHTNAWDCCVDKDRLRRENGQGFEG
eukprot:1675058-Pleurochrysis_carterae.AAC.5